MLLEENVRRAACLINSFSLQRRHRDVNGCSCGSLPFWTASTVCSFFPRGIAMGLPRSLAELLHRFARWIPGVVIGP